MEGSALRFLTFLFLPRGRIGRAEFWIGLFVHIWILRRLAVPQAIMALAVKTVDRRNAAARLGEVA